MDTQVTFVRDTLNPEKITVNKIAKSRGIWIEGLLDFSAVIISYEWINIRVKVTKLMYW